MHLFLSSKRENSQQLQAACPAPSQLKGLTQPNGDSKRAGKNENHFFEGIKIAKNFRISPDSRQKFTNSPKSPPLVIQGVQKSPGDFPKFLVAKDMAKTTIAID